MNKTGRFAKIILMCALAAFAVSMLLLSAFMGQAVRPDARLDLGYSALIVTTEKGLDDMVVIDAAEPESFREGDVIICRSVNEVDYGRIVYREIRSVTTDGDGRLAFVTGRVGEDSEEEFMTDASLVIGRELFHIADTGELFRFLMSVPGCIVCVMLPFAILIVLQCGSMAKRIRRRRAENEQLNENTKGAVGKV